MRKAVIRQQFDAYEPFSSRYPGSWEKTFKTRDEACDYLGFDKID